MYVGVCEECNKTFKRANPKRGKSAYCSYNCYLVKFRRDGSAKKGKYVPFNHKNRFWSRVEKEGDCLVWRGATSPTGKSGFVYGEFWMNGDKYATHRAVYKEFYGEIPKGLYVCHTCDVPLCVNPEHLYAGTPLDNMTDAIERGRHNQSGLEIGRQLRKYPKDTLCLYGGCKNPIQGRGLCNSHYMHWWRGHIKLPSWEGDHA